MIDVSALIKQGWRYEDFPRMRPAVWALILEGLGTGNFHVLSEASYGPLDAPEWRRGQLVIAPAGRESLSNFYKVNEARFAAATAADDAAPTPSNGEGVK